VPTLAHRVNQKTRALQDTLASLLSECSEKHKVYLAQKGELDVLQEKHDLLQFTCQDMKAKVEATTAKLQRLENRLRNARQLVQSFDESKAARP
jgi:chromosome segregation ATPase